MEGGSVEHAITVFTFNIQANFENSSVIFRYFLKSKIVSGQYSSVTQSCPTLCNPMDCSTPGFSVHHQLPEFTQTHVHCVGDAIQPSHPLSSPSPPAFNLSQHKGHFQRVSSSYHVAKVPGGSASASVLSMNI